GVGGQAAPRYRMRPTLRHGGGNPIRPCFTFDFVPSSIPTYAAGGDVGVQGGRVARFQQTIELLAVFTRVGVSRHARLLHCLPPLGVCPVLREASGGPGCRRRVHRLLTSSVHWLSLQRSSCLWQPCRTPPTYWG